MDAPRAWLALWNDVAPGIEAEYEAWHGGEHVPERLTVEGIEVALRYVAEDTAMPRYFTWYALRDLEVLRSAAYRRLVEQPGARSRRMRPRLRNLRRLACRTLVAGAAQPPGRIVTTLLERRPEPLPAAAPGTLLGEVAPEASRLHWIVSQPAGSPQPRCVLLAPPEPCENPAPYRLIAAYTRWHSP